MSALPNLTVTQSTPPGRATQCHHSGSDADALAPSGASVQRPAAVAGASIDSSWSSLPTVARPRSGVRTVAESTTLTALTDTRERAALAAMPHAIPYGVPHAMIELRSTLERLTGTHARWSVVPCTVGGWVASARGPRGMVLTAHGDSLDQAVDALLSVAQLADEQEQWLTAVRP